MPRAQRPASARRQRHATALHRAAWPNILANLQSAYAELTRAQLALEHHATEIDETRDLFERVIKSMSEAMFLMDHTGRVIRVNPAAGTLLECAESELVGRRLDEVCGTPDIPATPWQLLAQTPGGILPSLDVEIRSQTGHHIPSSVSCSLVRDRWGKITGVLVVVRDISDRIRSQETRSFLVDAGALLGSSLDYETTLRNVVRVAVPFLADLCIVDIMEKGLVHHLAVAHVDPAQEEFARQVLSCYSPEGDAAPSVISSQYGQQPDLIPEISDPELERWALDPGHLESLRALGLESFMRVPLRSQGTTRGALLFFAAGSGRRYSRGDLSLAEDLTHRAAMAIDNARLYDNAQAAIRLRDEFLSLASHELKTPVTTLLGYAQVLDRRAKRNSMTSEQDRRAIRMMAEQAGRLTKLITSLLDPLRIETGNLLIQLQDVDLCSLAHRLVEELHMATQLEVSGHSIELQSSAAGLIVKGDEQRLEQVLQNLLQNAIKYSPAGGIVSLCVEQQGDQAVISVSDQGIGIPAEAQAQLFQRFFRATNVRGSSISGMGIGLYVVKEIVDRHGGTVEIHSREGEGSTFVIRLPLATAVRAANVTSPDVELDTSARSSSPEVADQTVS